MINFEKHVIDIEIFEKFLFNAGVRYQYRVAGIKILFEKSTFKKNFSSISKESQALHVIF